MAHLTEKICLTHGAPVEGNGRSSLAETVLILTGWQRRRTFEVVLVSGKMVARCHLSFCLFELLVRLVRLSLREGGGSGFTELLPSASYEAVAMRVTAHRLRKALE